MLSIPPSGSFFIILFFIVRRQERDCGQVFILCSDTSHDAESMNLAVYARAAALFDCNLNVPVILQNTFMLLQNQFKAINNDSIFLSITTTNLSAVTKQQDGRVCGIDVNCLQLYQVV